MARSRNIKPGFFVNDELGEQPPEVRLLAIGLACIADRAGRLEDRPRKIKVQLLPYDDIDLDAALDALQSIGFIQRYAANESRYIQIVNFAKHQNPHKNEAPSSIPAPEQHQTSTVQAPEQHSSNRADSLLLVTDSLQETAPRKPQKRGSRLPDDWQPVEELRAWAQSQHPHVEHTYETEKFTDYWRSASGARGVKADWNATWKNWIRRADEQRPTRPRSSESAVSAREARNRAAYERAGGT